jgi:uncharacterized membrane protein
MDKDKLNKGAAVFASCYIKRWLKGRYDQLIDLPLMAQVKGLNCGKKLGIEATLAAVTAYASQKLPDQSPWALLAKSVLMDVAPEISSRLLAEDARELSTRLLEDTRAELRSESSGGRQSHQSVAGKLLALTDAELLGVLVATEKMDDAEKTHFLNFAARASGDELRQIAALPPEQRNEFLRLSGKMSGRGWMDSFKTFIKDFMVVAKAGARKTLDFSRPVLERYVQALLWVLKSSAVLWVLAVAACTAGAVCSRWPLFGVLVGLLVLSSAMIFWGFRSRKRWLSVAGMISSGVLVILGSLAAAGYPDAVLGVAFFFLVLPPMLALVVLLIPVTMLSELLCSLFPEAHATLMRAFQMLITAFFATMFFSVFLLVFPPKNPVALLVITPAVLVLALAIGFGLIRIHPEKFLRLPVILGMTATLFVLLGLMSMPNLRYRLQYIPETVDRFFAEPVKPLTVEATSKGEALAVVVQGTTLWYAERDDGGFDLYRSKGSRPCFAPDGRLLKKADSEAVRQKIVAWIDQAAAQKTMAVRAGTMQRYLNKEKLPAASILDAIVLVAGKDGLLNRSAERTLEDVALSRGMQSRANILTDAFVQDGMFDAGFEGNVSKFRELELSQATRYLWFGKLTTETETKTGYQGLTTCRGVLDLRCISAEDGSIKHKHNISASGVAFSAVSAQEQMIDKMQEQIKLTVEAWK